MFHDLLDVVATERPGLPLVLDGERVLTYGEAAGRSREIARELVELGVEPGDRVGIRFPKCVAGLLAPLAVSRTGATPVFLHHDWSLAYAEDATRRMGIRLLLTDPMRTRTRPRGPDGMGLLTLEDEGPVERQAATGPRPKAITCGEPVVIFFTSGSTGMPKGVVQTHRGMTAYGRCLLERFGIANECARLLWQMPLSFTYGFQQLLLALASGGSLVLERSPLVADVVDTMSRHRVTGLRGVPAGLAELVDELRSRSERLPDLRFVTNIGSAISRPVVEALVDLLPHTGIYLLYGLTEACGLTCRSAHDAPYRDGELGAPLPGVQACVRDGELLARAPWQFLGYWDDPAATARVLEAVEGEGTMLRTGDIVRQVESGFEYLGRVDDLFKVHGHRANPGEIERVAQEVPEVSAAVALPRPEPDGDCTIRLVYTGSADPEDVRSHCRGRLPPWLIPETIERRATDFPRTGMGKIDRGAV